MEHGLGNLTLDAVAKAAGISKGGLLHHFPSKQHLLNGLIQDLHEKFRARLSELAAADPVPQGRFARAYLKAGTVFRDDPSSQLCGILSIEARAEPAMRSAWRESTREMLRRQQDEIPDPVELAVVHLAADGLWLANLEGVFDDSPELYQRIVECLERMTRQ